MAYATADLDGSQRTLPGPKPLFRPLYFARHHIICEGPTSLSER